MRATAAAGQRPRPACGPPAVGGLVSRQCGDVLAHGVYRVLGSFGVIRAAQRADEMDPAHYPRSLYGDTPG